METRCEYAPAAAAPTEAFTTKGKVLKVSRQMQLEAA